MPCDTKKVGREIPFRISKEGFTKSFERPAVLACQAYSCPRVLVPSCPRVGGDEPHCAQDVWRARDVESHFDLRDDPDPRFAVWGEPPKPGGGGGGGGGFREEVSNSGRRRPLMIDCLL